MKVISILTVLAIVVYPICAPAATGISIGAKVGSSDYSGDVLPGSGDVGSDLSWGLVLGFGTLPMMDFQLRGGYFVKEFDYTYSAAGEDVTIPFEYRDTSVSLFLKSNLFAPPTSVVAVYAGAGLGMHWMNTEVAIAASQGSISGADEPVSLLENTGKLSAEGLVGLRVSAPGMPLSIFGEASYGAIFASEQLSLFDVSGGLLISF